MSSSDKTKQNKNKNRNKKYKSKKKKMKCPRLKLNPDSGSATVKTNALSWRTYPWIRLNFVI